MTARAISEFEQSLGVLRTLVSRVSPHHARDPYMIRQMMSIDVVPTESIGHREWRQGRRRRCRTNAIDYRLYDGRRVDDIDDVISASSQVQIDELSYQAIRVPYVMQVIALGQCIHDVRVHPVRQYWRDVVARHADDIVPPPRPIVVVANDVVC
jgi:hypothetical protein